MQADYSLFKPPEKLTDHNGPVFSLCFSHWSQWLPPKKNLQTTDAREDAEKREPSYTVGVNWYSHCGETVWRFLKKLKIEEPYDPAIPLLGIYPEKTII